MLLAGNMLKWPRSTCAAHVLNLVVQTDAIPAIKELSDIIGKCQKVVSFFQFKGAEVSDKQQEIRYREVIFRGFLSNY